MLQGAIDASQPWIWESQAGTMGGGRKARQNQDAKNQQAQSQQKDKINTYNRAVSACMEGRGYTIK